MSVCQIWFIILHTCLSGQSSWAQDEEKEDFWYEVWGGVPEESDHSGRPGDAFDAKLKRNFPEVNWAAFHWSLRNSSVTSDSPSTAQRLMGLPTASGFQAPAFWGLAAHTAPAKSLAADHLIPLGAKDVKVYASANYCKYHSGAPGVKCGELASLPAMRQYLKEPVQTLEQLRSYEEKIFAAAKQTDEFEEADVLLCQFPPTICSAFFLNTDELAEDIRTYGNKHMVIELGWRHDMSRQGDAACVWAMQISAILRSRPRHLVVAHTAFDVAYVHHFTGLGDRVNLIEYTSGQWLSAAALVPRSAQYTNSTILLLPDRRNNPAEPDLEILKMLHSYLKSEGIEAATARELYGTYTPQQVLQHQAVVAIPYSEFSFQLADWYWLGMTIFAPTPRLLGFMHYTTGVVYEFIQFCHGDDYGPCAGCSAPGWNASESGHAWAPRDVWIHTKKAEYWFSLFWIYSVPHVKYFSGLQELIWQLKDFSVVDARRNGMLIRARNKRVLEASRHQWHVLLTSMLAT